MKMNSCWRRCVTDMERPGLDCCSSSLEGITVASASLFGCGLRSQHGYPLCTTDQTVGDWYQCVLSNDWGIEFG